MNSCGDLPKKVWETSRGVLFEQSFMEQSPFAFLLWFMLGNYRDLKDFSKDVYGLLREYKLDILNHLFGLFDKSKLYMAYCIDYDVIPVADIIYFRLQSIDAKTLTKILAVFPDDVIQGIARKDLSKLLDKLWTLAVVPKDLSPKEVDAINAFIKLANRLFRACKKDGVLYRGLVNEFKRGFRAYFDKLVAELKHENVDHYIIVKVILYIVGGATAFRELAWELFASIFQENEELFIDIICSNISIHRLMFEILCGCPPDLKGTFQILFSRENVRKMLEKVGPVSLYGLLCDVNISSDYISFLFETNSEQTKGVLGKMINDILRDPIDCISRYLKYIVTDILFYEEIVRKSKDPAMECFIKLLRKISNKHMPWVLRLILELRNDLIKKFLEPQNFFELSPYYLEYCKTEVIKRSMWTLIKNIIINALNSQDNELLGEVIYLISELPEELVNKLVSYPLFISSLEFLKQYVRKHPDKITKLPSKLVTLIYDSLKDEIERLLTSEPYKLLQPSFVEFFKFLYKKDPSIVERILYKEILDGNSSAFLIAVNLIDKNKVIRDVLEKALLELLSKNSLKIIMNFIDYFLEKSNYDFNVFSKLLRHFPRFLLRLKQMYLDNPLEFLEKLLDTESTTVLFVLTVLWSGTGVLIPKGKYAIEILWQISDILDKEKLARRYIDFIVAILSKVLMNFPFDEDLEETSIEDRITAFSWVFSKIPKYARLLSAKQINEIFNASLKLIKTMPDRIFALFLVWTFSCTYDVSPAVTLFIFDQRIAHAIRSKINKMPPDDFLDVIEYLRTKKFSTKLIYYFTLSYSYVNSDALCSTLLKVPLSRIVQLFFSIEKDRYYKRINERMAKVIKPILEERVQKERPQAVLMMINNVPVEAVCRLMDVLDKYFKSISDKTPTRVLVRMLEAICTQRIGCITGVEGFQNFLKILLRRNSIEPLVDNLILLCKKDYRPYEEFNFLKEKFKDDFLYDLINTILLVALKFRNYHDIISRFLRIVSEKFAERRVYEAMHIISAICKVLSTRRELFPMLVRFLNLAQHAEREHKKRKFVLARIEKYRIGCFWVGINLLMQDRRSDIRTLNVLLTLNEIKAYRKVSGVLKDFINMFKFSFEDLLVHLCSILSSILSISQFRRRFTRKLILSGIRVLTVLIYSIRSNGISIKAERFIKSLNTLRQELAIFLHHERLRDDSLYKAYVELLLELLDASVIIPDNHEIELLLNIARNTRSIMAITKILKIFQLIAKHGTLIRSVIELLEIVENRLSDSTNWDLLQAKYRLLGQLVPQYHIEESYIRRELMRILRNITFNKRQRRWVDSLSELMSLTKRLYEWEMISLNTIKEILDKTVALEWVGQVIYKYRDCVCYGTRVEIIAKNFLEKVHMEILNILELLLKNKETNVDYFKYLNKLLEPKIVREEYSPCCHLYGSHRTYHKNVYRNLYDQIVNIMSLGLRNELLSYQLIPEIFDKLLHGCIAETEKEEALKQLLKFLGESMLSIPHSEKAVELETEIENIIDKYKQRIEDKDFIEKLDTAKEVIKTLIERISMRVNIKSFLEKIEDLISDIAFFSHKLKQALKQNHQIRVSITTEMYGYYEEIPNYELCQTYFKTRININLHSQKVKYSKKIEDLFRGEIGDIIKPDYGLREGFIRHYADKYLEVAMRILKNWLENVVQRIKDAFKKRKISAKIETKSNVSKKHNKYADYYDSDLYEVFIENMETSIIVKTERKTMKIKVIEITKTLTWTCHCYKFPFSEPPKKYPTQYTIEIIITNPTDILDLKIEST